MRIPVDTSIPAQNPQLSTFKFGDQQIRVIDKDGQPWFVAVDLAKALGYHNTHDAGRLLDDDEKGAHIVRTLGGKQKLVIVNESGMYALVLEVVSQKQNPSVVG